MDGVQLQALSAEAGTAVAPVELGAAFECNGERPAASRETATAVPVVFAGALSDVAVERPARHQHGRPVVAVAFEAQQAVGRQPRAIDGKERALLDHGGMRVVVVAGQLHQRTVEVVARVELVARAFMEAEPGTGIAAADVARKPDHVRLHVLVVDGLNPAGAVVQDDVVGQFDHAVGRARAELQRVDVVEALGRVVPDDTQAATQVQRQVAAEGREPAATADILPPHLAGALADVAADGAVGFQDAGLVAVVLVEHQPAVRRQARRARGTQDAAPDLRVSGVGVVAGQDHQAVLCVVLAHVHGGRAGQVVVDRVRCLQVEQGRRRDCPAGHRAVLRDQRSERRGVVQRQRASVRRVQRASAARAREAVLCRAIEDAGEHEGPGVQREILEMPATVGGSHAKT